MLLGYWQDHALQLGLPEHQLTMPCRYVDAEIPAMWARHKHAVGANPPPIDFDRFVRVMLVRPRFEAARVALASLLVLGLALSGFVVSGFVVSGFVRPR